MRRRANIAALLLAGILIALAVVAAVPPASDAGKRWVCPPCGLPCDDAVHDAPGTCPKCGMALIEESAAQAALAERKRVAVLLFDGVEIIDYSGPYEVFGAAGFDVYTVGETTRPIVTAMGLTVVPRYAFADAPRPDVLVVPGGGVRSARGSAATLKWVADVASRARHTMSVCNGAFILASAGLLDGLSATTTASNLDRLRNEFPKVKVVADKRYVDNGGIITTGGLTAGIDGALHVVALTLGKGTAQEVALEEEYDWKPDGGFARATLADLLIPDVELAALGRWKMVRTEGGTDRWEMALHGTSDLDAAELLRRIGRSLAAGGRWTAASPASTSARTASDWRFAGRDGEPWSGRLSVEPAPGEAHGYDLLLAIARADRAATASR